jgi:3-phosphoinositide dependent protein kinase-1
MMISGKSPFKGQNQQQTFLNIKNGNLNFTEDFPSEAKDLITKLLCMDPSQRLGAGPYGSENDYVALKSHPYFKNIDFDKVFLMETPYNFKKFQRSTLR